MKGALRPSHWIWAPGVCLATGSIISSAAGSLLVQYSIEGTHDGPVRITLLIVATLVGGALVWWAAQLNSRRSARAGWFLHCTAATAGYQRQRFESEDRAYRQWALQAFAVAAHPAAPAGGHRAGRRNPALPGSRGT